jgi:cytochrome P450 / NADPH-cytochrome P450 reductase
VPQFGVGSDEDRIIGGHYLIPKGSSIGVLIMKSHHDPAVYGEDADEFKPERMLDEPFNKLPPNSWKRELQTKLIPVPINRTNYAHESLR